MSRLTRRAENGTAVYATPSGEPVKWENNRREVLQKLAGYEDLEEQGLLLKLPCKVGDNVYSIRQQFMVEENAMGNIIKELKVDNFIYNHLKNFVIICKNPIGDMNEEEHFFPSSFGKRVFLTEEEAEAKLKELESE